MWLKIAFQVEYRVLPLPCLLPLHRRAADSSLHSWIFIEKFLFEGDAKLKLDHRSKYRPRLSLAAVSFPVFSSFSLTELSSSRGSEQTEDSWLFIFYLHTHRHNMYCVFLQQYICLWFSLLQLQWFPSGLYESNVMNNKHGCQGNQLLMGIQINNIETIIQQHTLSLWKWVSVIRLCQEGVNQILLFLVKCIRCVFHCVSLCSCYREEVLRLDEMNWIRNNTILI